MLKLFLITSRYAGVYFGFKITIEIFIRVEFRGIGRKIEHRYFLLVVFQPLFNFFAMMSTKIIQNQKHFTSGIFSQPSHKIDQNLAGHGIAIHHEPHLALIGDGGNHIDAFCFGSKPDDRSSTLGSKPSNSITVRLNSGFISPVNLSFFFFRLSCNGRVLSFKPLFDGLRVLLIGAFDRLLRCKPPALEIFPDSTNRHTDAIMRFNQKPNSIPGPQGKTKFQLLRRFVNQTTLNLFFFFRQKRTFLAMPASPFAKFYCAATLLFVALPYRTGMAFADPYALSNCFIRKPPCFRRRTTCLRISYWVLGLCFGASIFSRKSV